MSEDHSNDSHPPRRRRFGCLWAGGAFCLIVLGWCHYTPLNRFSSASLAALRSDSEAVFYSIEPWPDDDPMKGFHGHEIVGQKRVDDTDIRESFADFIATSTHGAWDRAACFDPRHAFRARGSDGVYDFLLCFQCGQAVVYSPDGRREWVLIVGKPDLLNDYLRQHSIPRPKH